MSGKKAISLIYSFKSRGPKKEHCDTSDFTGESEEVELPITTCWHLQLKSDTNRKVGDDILKWLIGDGVKSFGEIKEKEIPDGVSGIKRRHLCTQTQNRYVCLR